MGMATTAATSNTMSETPNSSTTSGVARAGKSSSKKGGNDSLYGLGLIGFSLVMDAVTGGLQDKVKAKTKTINPEAKSAKPTMHESMFYTNVAGCLVALVLALLTGHLVSGVKFCAAQARPQG